jgi:hypothetical protein
LARIRILIAGMPQFLADVVRDTLNGHADLDLVDDDCAAEVLLTPEALEMPDVLIVGLNGGVLPAFCAPLLYGNPQMKVLAVSATGHDSALFELRPHRVALGNVTPDGLLAAIRGTFKEAR